jgi:hypothetical protein
MVAALIANHAVFVLESGLALLKRSWQLQYCTQGQPTLDGDVPSVVFIMREPATRAMCVFNAEWLFPAQCSLQEVSNTSCIIAVLRCDAAQ